MTGYIDYITGTAADPDDCDIELVSGQARSSGGEVALLFVHGLGHGAWCWDRWQALAVDRGVDSWALSCRGHGGSGGTVRGATISAYVRDVRRTVEHLAPRPVVLVGHSLGGLVVQRLMAEGVSRNVRGAVLVSSIPSGPAFSSVFAVATRHPVQAMRFIAGLPMRLPKRLIFADASGHEGEMKRLQADSPLVQYQLLFHRRPAVTDKPVLVIGGADDRLVPLATQLRTARRYGAETLVVDDAGHDVMLESSGDRALDEILGWSERLPA
ncbi:alpha/beta hydrolase [Nocardioides sp. CPCC 206347]|uniref:alpha/beta hydrolase n=1 Tax=unclassified Nocardioides TaxID=2615069 RepID=UPI00360BA778